MSITSTGLGDFKKGAAADGAAHADVVGAYTIKEFAELFRISRSTVYNEARAGRCATRRSSPKVRRGAINARLRRHLDGKSAHLDSADASTFPALSANSNALMPCF